MRGCCRWTTTSSAGDAASTSTAPLGSRCGCPRGPWISTTAAAAVIVATVVVMVVVVFLQLVVDIIGQSKLEGQRGEAFSIGGVMNSRTSSPLPRSLDRNFA